jgi:hypothetical protein
MFSPCFVRFAFYFVCSVFLYCFVYCFSSCVYLSLSICVPCYWPLHRLEPQLQWTRFISYHIISYHIISYHIISYHIMWRESKGGEGVYTQNYLHNIETCDLFSLWRYSTGMLSHQHILCLSHLFKGKCTLGADIFTSVHREIVVFCDVTSCSLVCRYQLCDVTWYVPP